MSSSRVQSHRVGQSSEHVTCQGTKVPVYDMCIHTRAWHPTLINLQQPTDFEEEWNMNSQPLCVWFSKFASQHDSCKILTSKNSTDCRNLRVFGLSLIKFLYYSSHTWPSYLADFDQTRAQNSQFLVGGKRFNFLCTLWTTSVSESVT
jgi:hypothetical protein